MSAFFSQIMKGNKGLWIIYITLLVLSCVVTFSAMSRLALRSASVSAPFLRHLLFLIVGFALIVLLQIVNFRVISLSSIPLLLGATVILAVVTATGGISTNAASRFSSFGQPSEYVKLGLILTLADVIMHIRRCKEFPVKAFWIVIAVVGVLIFLIFLENLSSAILIYSIVFVMMIAGGIDLRRLGFVLLFTILLGGAVISIAWIFPEKQFMEMSEEHPMLRKAKRAYTWKARIERYFNSDEESEAESDKVIVTDKNRQEVYAKVAVCRGGWVPNGLGSSLQRNYLPEAYSDYVYAIAVEEWGFGMGMFIIALYLSIFGIALYYIRKEDKVYRKMLLLGCAFAITIQAAVHIAVSVGAMPVTGQTLPLISRGGSSILVVSVMMGIMIKITATQGAEAVKIAEVQEEVQPQEKEVENVETQEKVEEKVETQEKVEEKVKEKVDEKVEKEVKKQENEEEEVHPQACEEEVGIMEDEEEDSIFIIEE